MRSLAVRLTLLGTFVIASGVSAYLFFLGETRSREEVRVARAFGERALGASREIVELRAAQQAYVAAGQGDEFWASKVAGSVSRLKDLFSGLRASASSPRAQAALDNAASALLDFEQMDVRARDNVRTGQKLLASSIIFGDGLELTNAASASIDAARAAEVEAGDAALATIRQRQLFAAGAAAAAAFLVILLLVPRTGSAPAPQERPSLSIAPKTPAPAPVGLHTGEEGWTAARRISEPVQKPSIDVTSVAALCTDLARVADTRSLTSLLERAAVVLDATGIVLWISDPDGRELTPIVTHGYLPPVVVRLGTIQRDAQNATAAAFRTELVQTVKGDDSSNGAIAAPLVTPAGAVGVMAAEVRNAGERDAEKLAAASIVAAQLATLVGPPSARSQSRSEAAGA
jgi:hypothetical protein